MTSARAKGSQTEIRAQKALEAEGWMVYRVPLSRAWTKSVDIFHLWDLFAVRKGEYKLVQIKTNKKPSLTPYEQFWQENMASCLSCEVWVWYNRNSKVKSWKGWRKIIIR